MNDLIRNIVVGTAIAAIVAGLSAVASMAGEPAGSADRCAAVVVKMPCL
jgi:hypothetical protein